MEKKISLIVPCYNEAANISDFYEEVKKYLDIIEEDYELLFIDDGSYDETLNEIKKIMELDDSVHYLSFSRNFGKEASMYAGFKHATGDYVAVIDADLQDPPELIPEMVSILKKGEYDSVATRRTSRSGEPIIRSFFSSMFYKVINRITDVEIISGARDYRLMTRPMVDAILTIGEKNRFSKGIFGWIGFRTYWLPYENVERNAGKTKWSFQKLVKYAINGITNYSEVPLAIASWLGVIFSILGFLAVAFIITRKIIFGDPVAGWASIVSIIIFIGGVQLFCLGIIGKYLAKVYLETKERPLYIVSESNIDGYNKEW